MEASMEPGVVGGDSGSFKMAFEAHVVRVDVAKVTRSLLYKTET